MVWAKEHGKEFDSFEILTDNETFAGDIKPTQALAEYRRASGIDARLAVVGMTSSGFSIADPTDVGQLDVVGFDTSTPNVISDFFRG
jgi:60 kDa SS-A/Ro ribonucleoprotein